MERSEIRVALPHCASLHAGYRPRSAGNDFHHGLAALQRLRNTIERPGHPLDQRVRVAIAETQPDNRRPFPTGNA